MQGGRTSGGSESDTNVDGAPDGQTPGFSGTQTSSLPHHHPKNPGPGTADSRTYRCDFCHIPKGQFLVKYL